MIRHRSLLDLKRQAVVTTPPRRTLAIRGLDQNVVKQCQPVSPPRIMKREVDYVNPLLKLLSLRGCPHTEVVHTPTQAKLFLDKRVEKAIHLDVPKPPLLVRRNNAPQAVNRRLQEVLKEEEVNEPAEDYCCHNFKLPEKKSCSDLQKSHYRSMSSPIVSWDEIIAPLKPENKQV